MKKSKGSEGHRGPRSRPRRLRRTPWLRELVAETFVEPQQLIQPHFVLAREQGREEIPSMPGIERLGVDDLLVQVERDLELGLRSVLLFGLPAEESKDPGGSRSADPAGAVPVAVRALRRRFGADLTIITDVCLCAYTDHGHCGILAAGEVENDATLPVLAAMARAHAEAGADVVAPSDMMDGRVRAIRDELDEAGFQQTAILSYAVKYASAYYGPFRDAASSAPTEGDRRGYQMDPRNAREALREARLDEEEGADLIMVKPGLPYLDILLRLRAITDLPLVAYNVSGEYGAVKAAAARGWLDEGAVVRENLIALRRAGADAIITYHGRDALREGWLA